MKEQIYKIIAMTTVLLGALGPQVASGQANQTLVQPVVQKQNQVVMVVLNQPAISSSLVSTSELKVNSCDNLGSSQRVDLLLWQGCNNLAIAQGQPLPKLAVVGQPTYLPKLIAQASQNYSPKSSIRAIPNQENLAVLVGGLLVNIETIRKNQPVLVSQSNNQLIQFTDSQQNYLENVVMRC